MQKRTARRADNAVAARICWHHFKEGLTQQEIAERVGMSRATVNKIISEARADGLVRVTIDSDITPCLEVESGLVETFGLDEAVVVPAPAKPLDAYVVVGHATGDFISRHLGKGQMLGMSWGGTPFPGRGSASGSWER